MQNATAFRLLTLESISMGIFTSLQKFEAFRSIPSALAVEVMKTFAAGEQRLTVHSFASAMLHFAPRTALDNFSKIIWAAKRSSFTNFLSTIFVEADKAQFHPIEAITFANPALTVYNRWPVQPAKPAKPIVGTPASSAPPGSGCSNVEVSSLCSALPRS